MRSHSFGVIDPAGPAWLDNVRSGCFQEIPGDLRWDDSVQLAHLVDGYELAAQLGLGDPFDFEERQLEQALEHGRWNGGPAVLWTTLFLEHRRWKTAPVDSDPEMKLLLDRLCRQLASSLKTV